MLDKIKKLLAALNVFQKVEEIIVSKVITKGVKSAIQALIGLLAAQSILPTLGDAGVSIDFTKLESWGVVALTGVVGSLWNWIKKRYDFQK